MEKKHLIIPAMVAALLSTSATSFAQDRNHGGDRDNGRYGQRDRGDDRHDGYQARGGGRGNEGYGGGDRHWDGAGPSHDLRRGNRLPAHYRNNQYVVNNWREHRLRQPPRGYHWVQTGGDYVLAAVATGIIADLIVNH